MTINIMNDYLFSVFLIATGLATGIMLFLIAPFLLNRLKLFNKGLHAKWKLIQSPLRFLLPTLCLSWIVPLLRLPEQAHHFVGNFIRILLVASFGWLAVRIVYIVRDILLNRYNINERDNMRARIMHTQMSVITNIVNVIIAVLSLSFILMTFSEVRHIGLSLLASAGIMGIVIGFAAQKTLGNLISGIQIAIAQPIRIDDVVVIERILD